MPKHPHLKLDTSRQNEPSVALKFNYGFPEEEEEERNENPNYFQMATSFRAYLNRLNADYERRIQERTIPEVLEHIEYISILFQNQFSIKAGANNYYQDWYNEFGLLGVNFSQFNHRVLFSVVDTDKFRTFLRNIDNFINKESGVSDVAYSRKIVYIKEFKLFTSGDIIQYQEQSPLMNFRLIDFPLDSATAEQIYTRLTTYLSGKNIQHRLIDETNNLEVFNITDNDVREIANNFDIVLSITSSLAGVIRPSEFNLEERNYGFDVRNGDEDLPIIGILDTGISNATPIAPLLIQDTTFNITGSSPFEDNANGGYGHGTAVAALAALGRTPYASQYRGSFSADAKLLSIKILDGNSGFLSELDVLTLLKGAKEKYPQIKIFVLTVCYARNKATNEHFSTYAFELDKFSHENDCLIFICTANNNDASLHNNSYDLNYFSREVTNLCSPAESLNNVIVGGAAHCIKDGVFHGISNGREYPRYLPEKVILIFQICFR